MRRYSVFHAFVLSFYSKEFYRDVGRYWRWVSFFYLLILVAAAWGLSMVSVHRGVNRVADTEGVAIAGQIPPIQIRDGVATVAASQPYVITDPADQQVLAVLDTTGQITSLDETDAKLLLTEDRVMVRRNAREVRMFSLGEIADLDLDEQVALAWLDLIKRWFAVVVYPFAVAFGYLFRVVQVLIYACIGLAFNRVTGAKLTYPGLISVSIMAVTPVVVTTTVLGLAAVSVPMASLVGFAAAMGFLYYGVKANAVGADLNEWDLPDDLHA